MLCAACEPDNTQFITVHAASDPALTDSAFLYALSNTGLSDRYLRNVGDSNFGTLEYRTDYEKRIYMFQGDIELGVLGGEYLQFPLPVTPLDTRTTVIPPPDGPKWGSIRVYDVGVCSSLIGWRDIGDTLFGVLLAQLEGRSEIIGVSRFSPSRILPVLRMTGPGGVLQEDLDTIILQASFHVDEIDGPGNEGCTNVDLDMTLEVQLVLTPPYHQDTEVSGQANTLCFNRGVFAGPWPEGTLPPNRAPEGADVGAKIVHLSVGVAETAKCGWLAGPDYIENLVVEQINNQLSGVIRDEVISRTVLPGARFLPGAENRACTCDIECSEGARLYVRPRRGGVDRLEREVVTNPYGAGSGYRHDCVAGRCALRIEPERIFSRPDGIELVFAEDIKDGLYPLLQGQRECFADRNSVLSGEMGPVRGDVTTLAIP